MATVSNREVPRIIAARLGFQANSMKGSNRDYSAASRRTVHPTGELPRGWLGRLNADEQEHGIRYVVWSYETPIMWERGDGVIVVPDVFYSMTTARHQAMCRRAREDGNDDRQPQDRLDETRGQTA